MKAIPRTPDDRELNSGTGLTLAVLGAAMLVLCGLADGHFASLPALFGGAFLTGGILIWLVTRHRRNRRQKGR